MLARKRSLSLVAGTLLALSAVSCGFVEDGIVLPDTPTADASPTPNLTLTAVFAPSPTSPVEAPPEPTDVVPTPPIVQPSATPEASATPRDPTETLPPTITPTVYGFTPVSAEFTPAAGEEGGGAAAVFPGFTPLPGLERLIGPNPTVRSGPSVEAAFQSTAPTIDGDFGEWSAPSYSADAVVFGAGYHSGDTDASATFQVGWDYDHLYIGAAIKDSAFVQESSGSQLFRGDSLEVLLDVNVQADFFDRTADADDYQLGLSPGESLSEDEQEAYLWLPLDLAGSRSEVKIGVQETADGYQLEAAIPWIIFDVLPLEGQHFGFALSVSDNDSEGELFQQSMVSNAPRRFWSNPTTWGDLLLVK